MKQLYSFISFLAIGASAWGVSPSGPLTPGPLSPFDDACEIGRCVPMGLKAAGKGGRTEKRRLGERNPLVPPFVETFDNFRYGLEWEDFERYFQVIDSNEDERYWRLYNYAQAEPYGRCAYLLYTLDGNKADDWLIPRAMELEGGKHYCVSLDAATYTGGRDHSLEVKFGQYNDAKGLNVTVIPETTINTQKFRHLEGWINPEEDGVYYIGIHALSTNQDYLFADNISVGAAKAGTVPSVVTDLTMTNDPDGKPQVDISFNSPSVNLDGGALDAITSIVIERGDVKVATLTDVTPGKACRFTDNTGTDGDYAYRITANNASGEGATLRCDHYVGLLAPMAPAIVSFRELEDDSYECEWTVPTTDVNGNAINPEQITYCVYDVSKGSVEPVAEGVKTNKVVLYADMQGQLQVMAQLLVTAVVGDKESEGAATGLLMIGEPYPLPYHNSFAGNDLVRYVMGAGSEYAEVVWRFIDDHSDPTSQDGDNGYVCMIGTAPNQTGEVFTGKIDLRQATAPALSFYTYVYSEDNNELKVCVTDVATGEESVVATEQLSDLPRVGWNRLFYPLSDFAGKIVSISIKPRIVSHGYVPVDNMLVTQLNDIDLRIESVSAPASAHPDEQFGVYATVMNNGYKPVGPFKVVLSRDGKDVSSADVDGLAALDYTGVTLFDSFDAATSAMPQMTVRAEIAGEQNPDDNLSDPFTVAFRAPTYPTVKDLSGAESDGSVQLSWGAPDLSKAAPAEVVEDFESYAAFATQFGGWSMVDADKGYVGGFQDIEMPVDNTQQAFWIMEGVSPFEFIWASSGTKVAAQMFVLDADRKHAVQCDDWLISPELYGGPQTITFMASSLTTMYGYDKFEIYYSTTGTTLDCFKQIGVEIEPTDIWQQYVVSLPDGARYFAIRCTSHNIYMFMLDDFAFTPKGTPLALELKGYNVYRNGEKLTSEPIVQTSFATKRQLETDRYFVTAVYDLGESIASNVVAFGRDGVADVETDDAEGRVEIFDLRGVRLDGATAAPGVYFRRQGGKVEKVIVR